jgi:large subunit ribosomal protein L17
MRHRKKSEKLGRTSSHKEALLANLAVAFIMHGRITTTVTKSKALRPVVEKLITLGKRQDINARRRAASILRDKDAVKKLFSDVGPRFEGRNGGYTRIVRLGPRVGDAAPMAIIELVS